VPEIGACGRCGGPLRSGLAGEQTCLACLLAQGLPLSDTTTPWRPESLPSFLNIVNVLADGPRARLYLARWASPDGGFAVIKRSLAAVASEPDREREVARLLELDHPHVATVFDAGRDAEGRAYVITEYVPGTPLPEFWRRSDLLREERLELLRQVADTLAYLHGCRMTHANIKPTNVLVLAPPAGVKLLDFDAAIPREDAVGTSGVAFDPGPDVRGFGGLLSTILETGGPDPGIDAELRRLSQKAMADSPRERCSVREMAAELARYLTTAAPFRS